MEKVIYKTAKSQSEMLQIIALQSKNQEETLSAQELLEQGFVTVKHDELLLQKLSGDFGHAIAVMNQTVVGYALVMLKEFADTIPVLVPMFQKIGELSYQEELLSNTSYFVMGQICIDKPFRGKGIFGGLYQSLKEQLAASFQYCITEVATRNTRSIRAHEKIGFQTLSIYEAAGEEWVILLWDWR